MKGRMTGGRGHCWHLLLHRGILLYWPAHVLQASIHQGPIILLQQLSLLPLLRIEVLKVELQSIAEAGNTHVKELLEVILRWNR